MSSEKKDLIKRLDEYFIDNVIGASQKTRDLFREVRVAIEQESEVDEAYVEEKERELIDAIITAEDINGDYDKHFTCSRKIGIEKRKKFIRRIILDAQVAKLDIKGELTKYPNSDREEEWIRIR